MFAIWNLLIVFACTAASLDTADTGHRIFNAGPDGFSTAENSCGPDDGAALRFVIASLSETCLDENIDTEWSVVIQHHSDSIESGKTYSIGTDGLFFQDEPLYSAEGEFQIQFEGEFQVGSSYTGEYWMDGPDFHPIQGKFSGIYCEGEAICG